jgi:hemerythrin
MIQHRQVDINPARPAVRRLPLRPLPPRFTFPVRNMRILRRRGMRKEEHAMLQEWSDDFLVEIDEIDAQHRQFFAATHRLYDEIVNCRGENAVEGALDFLRQYAVEHFRTEEAFMRLHEFPRLEDHRKLHAEFIEKLDGLTEEFDVYRAPTQWMAEQILEMTQDWLIDHIVDEDIQYAQYVKTEP